MTPPGAAPPRAATLRFAALGIGLVALTAGGLALHRPGAVDIGSHARIDGFVALAVIATLLYFAAIAQLQRAPLPRAALWIVLGVALVTRLIALAGPPFLSSDIYRYVWDGRVQAAGINPYRYIPDAPALAPLRDAAIYPHIGRRDTARTIYPPVAQMLFFGVTRIGATIFTMKAAMLALELLAIGVMLHLLRVAGRPQAAILIYAWNPLTPWEFAGNGHIDAAALVFIALALLAATWRRTGLAALALAAATLCKLLPVALAPALWRRWDRLLPAAFVAAVAVAYLPYLGAGTHILGYLPGYTKEEGLRSGRGIEWLDLVGHVVTLPRWVGPAYVGLALLLLAALALRIAWRPALPLDPAARLRIIGRDMLVLATATTAVLTPHYPWYYGWLAYFACLTPAASSIWLAVAVVLFYAAPASIAPPLHAAVWSVFLGLVIWDIRKVRPGALPPDPGRGQSSPAPL